MPAAEITGPVQLDALGPRGPYRTRVPETVTDVSGAGVARLSLVPPVYADRALSALRAAGPVSPADLDALLGAAGEEFATGTVGGLGVLEYEHLCPLARARPLAAHLKSVAAGTRAWLGADGVVDDLGDGSAVLRPAVHQVGHPGAAQLRVELPFPNVWVAPWSRADGTAVLRDTLVLSALTRDRALVDALLAEPGIANVYVGDTPTHWMAPGVPHDGYLSDFLMRGKALAGPRWPPLSAA
ncbi:hypothetical protein AB0G32_28150 [Streptomyces sp. NPDC023723]|uniref:hypothetical protein n=1 Tax=Streptomyces sp. NPDC023723 TaxID=3154323 RepID=UPI0033EE1B87